MHYVALQLSAYCLTKMEEIPEKILGNTDKKVMCGIKNKFEFRREKIYTDF